MARALVIYDSKYGNTKLVAERIAENIRVAGEKDTKVISLDDVDVGKILGCDILVIGTPNHYSKPSKAVMEFVKGLKGLGLKGKRVAAFDTCLRKQEGKAYRRIERDIREIASDIRLITPGLSIVVVGTKGPILDGELPKCEDFGRRIVE